MTPRRRLAALLLAFVVLGAAYAGLARVGATWDLTAEGSASLSAETQRVLAEVERRVEVTAFFGRRSPGRVEAATLLSRYRDANRRITFRVLDPELAPAEARRLGVQQTGSAAVEDRASGEVEIAQYTIEIDVTSAIARLLRDVQGTVCFTTGHGERRMDDTSADGFSRAAALLADNGYEVQEVDLLTEGSLDGCDAAVVASPTTGLGDGARGELIRYLGADGKAWFLTEPSDEEASVTEVTQRWGIRFSSGVILEGDAGSHLPGDPAAPIVRRYAGGHPVVRGLGPTFFPRAQGVEVLEVEDRGSTVTELAATSRLGYLDRRDPSSFDPEVDVEGPVAIGVASDTSRVSRPGTERATIHRTRILAWGDVDFASNVFLGEGANARLWVQGLDWLTQPEDLVTAVPSFPKVRELELTEARSRYVLFLMAGVVPGMFLIAGAMVWVIRRGR